MTRGLVPVGKGNRSGSRPVIICFAGDSWDGHPHSRHHLMRRFADDYQVLFVEGVPMRSTLRGDRYAWPRIWRPGWWGCFS